MHPARDMNEADILGFKASAVAAYTESTDGPVTAALPAHRPARGEVAPPLSVVETPAPVVQAPASTAEPVITERVSPDVAAPEYRDVPIKDLVLDPRLQMRADAPDALAEKIQHYVDDLQHGAELPAPQVVWDGAGFLVCDGHLRVHAALQNGATQILVQMVAAGDNAFETAWRRALVANEDHGFKRNREDRRKAVASVLERHPEWSSRQIAAACAVSSDLVSRVAGQLGVERPGRRLGADGRVIDTTRIGAAVDCPIGQSDSVPAALEPGSDCTLGQSSTPAAHVAQTLDHVLQHDSGPPTRGKRTVAWAAGDATPSEIIELMQQSTAMTISFCHGEGDMTSVAVDLHHPSAAGAASPPNVPR